MEHKDITEVVISKLIAIRANEAFKKHETNFFDSIHKLEGETVLPLVYAMMPPRKKWITVGQETRRSRNLTKVTSERIKRTILRDMRLGRELPYLVRLHEFVKSVKEKLETGSIEAPAIGFVPKDATYSRPITLYSLADRIAINIKAMELTDAWDDRFEDCAVAFRSKAFRDRSELTNHHDVFSKIIDWKKESDAAGLPIFVAEADIKGFYDNVDKRMVKDWLKANNESDKLIDSYLAGFNFYGLLMGESFRKEVKVKHYRDDMEALDSEFDEVNYGLPQGGALSCLFANVVFSSVDRDIMRLVKASNGRLLYLRYCDDMIIMGNDEGLVKEAFSLYMEGTKKLRLPVHPPTEVAVYGKSFWAAKTKDVYQWSRTAMPWLSFLGYQMRYNSVLRMRPKSIEKELIAQKDMVDKILYRIWRSDKPVPPSLLYKLENRFFKRITGFCRENFHKAEGFSWNRGYLLLKDHPSMEAQFKLLDRKKIAQMNRLVKRGFKRPNFYSSYYQTMRRKNVRDSAGDHGEEWRSFAG